MECHSCHAPVQAGDRFCQSCGASLGEVGAKAPVAAAVEEERAAPRPRARPVEGGARRRAARDEDEDEVAPRRPGSKRNSSMGMWVGAFVVMAGIGLLIYWQKQEDDARKRPSHGGGGAPMGQMLAPLEESEVAPGGLEGPRVPSQADIEGTISVDPSLKDKIPSQGAFYVMARLAGAPNGPPIAAVKLAASPSPTPFVIGPADLMMGGDFNQPVSLQVRWDQDGDPLSKQATDLVGEAMPGPVQPGAKGVSVVLTRLHGADEVKAPVNLEEGHLPQAPGAMAASAPAAAPASAPAAAATGDIQGVIKVPAEQVRPAGGVLFVIARPAGVAGGPPLAVKRLAPGAGAEIPFSLGQADAMMGGDLNQPLSLQVRWDQDGNAMSKQPGDLFGEAPAPVSPGASGVELVLNQVL
jgi:hypothetical protein